MKPETITVPASILRLYFIFYFISHSCNFIRFLCLRL